MRLVLAAVAATLASTRPARAQDGEEPLSTTRHSVTVNGRALAYTARAGRLPIRHNETGEVLGQMFFVSYTLDRGAREADRPLTFVWNGGPGSNAALVHLVGFGPRRMVPPPALRAGGHWRLEDNPGTWLGSTDLVFVDPIGTGYSRPTKTEHGALFYSNRGDAESVAEFIRVYRTRFDRHDAPLFLAGESFGVTRAAGVAAVLQSRNITVRGTILIGLALPLGTLSQAQRTALSVPTLAAAAFSHRKLAPELQRDLEATLREAEAWAELEYGPALERRDSLTEAERDEIVRGLARFTGLDPALVDRRQLVVTRMQLGDQLLRREGRYVGQYDSRITGPLDTTQGMYDPTKDPSLDNLLDDVVVLRYLRHDLGYKSDLQYQGPFGGGYPGATAFRGDWMSLKWARSADNTPPTPWPPGVPRPAIEQAQPLRAAMEADPGLRVLVGCGLYDLVCDYHANAIVARSLATAYPDRITAKRYAGGHAMYTDPLVHPQFARDVAQFIRETLAGVPRSRSPSSSTGARISHLWKPVREGTDGVVAIEVRTVLEGLPETVAGAFALDVPMTYAGVRGIAERVQELQVRDAVGAVPLRIEDEPPHPGGFPHFRRYRAGRRVVAPVTFTYRSLAPSRPVGGPPFGLYAAHGGVSGAGSGFLVLPEGRFAAITRVEWDLTDLAPGSRAATTFGEGAFELSGAPADVRQGWIMAGPLGRFPATGTDAAFAAYWLGEPAWDPDIEMAWAARMYASLGKAYRYLDPLPPYRVFVRTGGRGGTALGSSFMVGATPREAAAAPSGEGPRETITHELGHLFVGGIDAPMGVSSWFTEGLNTYYTRLLPMRGGFTSIEAYGREINKAFQDYYFNVARNLSADSIVRVGFNDENIRHIPYIRGSLYFADLDAKIRAFSGGKRNLDQVIFALFERRKSGAPLNHDVWIATVVREAGPSARTDFEEIVLRGTRTLVPASDAFGPCFSRQPSSPTTVDGRERGPGFEWVRVTSVPDEVCRTPW